MRGLALNLVIGARVVINSVINFLVLSSGGTPYSPGASVLASDGTAYTVTKTVLSSGGAAYIVS